MGKFIERENFPFLPLFIGFPMGSQLLKSPTTLMVLIGSLKGKSNLNVTMQLLSSAKYFFVMLISVSVSDLHRHIYEISYEIKREVSFKS